MIETKALLPALREQVRYLAEDLLNQSIELHEIDEFLRENFEKYKESGRISQGFEEWREDYLEQVAVAWVLACVFVRFIEDNNLINECWIAGEGDRGKLADGSYELFFRQHPYETDREYLKFVFTEIGKIPAATELFAATKTPLWAVDPSGDAARQLLKFFKKIDPEIGGLRWSFATKQAKTDPIVEVYEKLAPQAQFLGDLYQDLSEHARKKYALLQTPDFIQRFILDRTLTQALDQFGLKNLRLIDPACGSGHFLLGAFDRLFEEWMKPEHGVNNSVVAAQNALESIFGTDINPFAIAISRFRLLVAAISACRIDKLNQQSYAWRLNLATGDSLLWGSKPGFNNERVGMTHQQKLFDEESILAVENPSELNRILGQGYHVVVGNPPYITVKDKSQNNAYRKLYSTCHRQYSLGVPFTQRFWELAIRKGERIKNDNEEVSNGSGYVGMITANSFMKREFGKKLVEDFFSSHDLTHVLDTSGAYIPGHGTPTVILFGRAQKPVGNTVRAVLGIKGEPSTPANPSQGLVWQSILKQIDRVGVQDNYTSSSDILRATFAVHPWSIGGGGALDLKEIIESQKCTLANLISLIGYVCMTRADDIYFVDYQSLRRAGFDDSNIVINVEGDAIRDWSITNPQTTVFPYDSDLLPISESSNSPVIKFLWPFKALLWTRREPNGDHRQLGLTWYEWSRFQRDRFRTPLSISFAFVATHNHFVLDRGGKVFKQSAPIIKLPADASIDDHLALLGLLNSSTACFWMKQTFHNKGDSTDQHGARTTGEPEFNTYEFTGTGLQRFPITSDTPTELARVLDNLANEHRQESPEIVISSSIPSREMLDAAKGRAFDLQCRMIAFQEELDWLCYRLYGLTDEELSYHANDIPNVFPGLRAFEFILARRLASGESKTAWFKRNRVKPVTEIPSQWPVAYRILIERRIRMIETNKEIGLIEEGMYKRRWSSEPWQDQEQRALKNWLLDRLETPKFRKGTKDNPELTTTAQMADIASADSDFLQVAELYRGRPDFDVTALVAELVEGESVPFLPILRYKLPGLRKRQVWERTWDLQRQQDAGKDVGDIPVPPKYATADFLKSDFWRLRGKLDVPKERWISYPHCSTESDQTLLVGWAGMNQLEQATALTAYYDARKREGWDAKRLTPLLAGLDQLLPWIHQWHPEIDPEFGETAGQSFQTMLEHDAHELGLTLEDIRNWTPPAKVRKTPAARKKKTKVEEDE